jgi:hypothetical protein
MAAALKMLWPTKCRGTLSTGCYTTCAKLGVSFWDYLGARLGITGHAAIPYLPDLVKARCQTA